MISGQKSQTPKSMKTTATLWASLEALSFPSLHELSPTDRDRFILLDAYLRDCLEEWCASGGHLSARSAVLLDDCARTITKRFTLLDGEGQHYFGQFRRLVRRILRGIDIAQAYRQAEQEIVTDPDLADFFGESTTNFTALVETSLYGE